MSARLPPINIAAAICAVRDAWADSFRYFSPEVPVRSSRLANPIARKRVMGTPPDQRRMGLVAAVLFLSGCCTPHAPITVPPKPELTPVTAEIWQEVGPNAREVWSSNQLAQKEYIERLIRRIEIHNGQP